MTTTTPKIEQLKIPGLRSANAKSIPASYELGQYGEDRIESAVEQYKPEAVESPQEEIRVCTPDFMAVGAVTGTEAGDVEGQRPRLMRVQTPSSIDRKQFPSLRKFWYRRVATAVPQKECRDHFALERTFLGYIRTSETLCIASIVVAQFFPLQPRASSLVGGVTYAELAKPISTLLMGLAMVIVFCGNMRFWRQQDAIIRGKIFTASWEPIVVGIIMLVVVTGLLAAVLTVNDLDAGTFQ